MSGDNQLKSAYELAMERLRAEEDEHGVQPVQPLSSEEKEEIKRFREEAKAKLAELEILHHDKLAGAQGDPEKLAKVEEQYRIDRQRVQSSLESAVNRVKKK